MRKLQFTAQHGQQQDVNESGVVQKQVQDLLVQKLGQFGFETLPQSGDQVAVERRLTSRCRRASARAVLAARR
jgi:hypothetical protein